MLVWVRGGGGGVFLAASAVQGVLGGARVIGPVNTMSQLEFEYDMHSNVLGMQIHRACIAYPRVTYYTERDIHSCHLIVLLQLQTNHTHHHLIFPIQYSTWL